MSFITIVFIGAVITIAALGAACLLAAIGGNGLQNFFEDYGLIIILCLTLFAAVVLLLSRAFGMI